MVRVKHRYILVQIRCNERPANEPIAISSSSLYWYIMDQVKRYYGEFGCASMLRLNVIYFNAKTHLCIIQSRHGPHRFITSILPLLTVAGSEVARYRTLYVGATVKQCQKFIIKYQQRYINKTIGEYKGVIQKQKLIEDVTKMKKM
ncbi:ribonuclease P/MRP protein subunit POP5 [Anopheles funestus]|uniref:Ribonuclease P/MRP protein subunit POP5 n=1 Tax=Anopheles funestus TaxID=62324 RepID=A0A182RZP0_ANOFN|nr:ribonuclease P/MRP protein subunit POP5 [Anopheles funestus]